MDSTRWSSTSLLGVLREVMELLPGPTYVLASDRRLLHANVHALGMAGAVDARRAQELAELTRPLAAPPGVHVWQVNEPNCRVHLVLDTSVPVDRDSAARAFARRHRFSPRQTEIFVLWMRGRSEGAIARALGRSIDTVKSHLKQVRAKSGIASKVELMNAVRRLAAR